MRHSTKLPFRLSLILLMGLGSVLMANPALAQQTTTRTGSNGNSQTTVRTTGGGQQTTIRTGPNGNSQTTTRTYN